jgi:hypothetical protein
LTTQCLGGFSGVEVSFHVHFLLNKRREMMNEDSIRGRKPTFIRGIPLRPRAWTMGLFVALLTVLPVSLVAAQEDPGNTNGNAVPVDRLMIKYSDGTGFEFMGMTSIEQKILPPSDELPAVQGENASPLAGFWYELLAVDGSVRYRRLMDNPVLLVFEGPDMEGSSDGEGVPDRKEGLPSERVFTILVPKVEPGEEVVIYGNPIAPDAQGEPAGELARFTPVPSIPPIG